jgi:uroporphyrinogen-III synthase
MENKIRLLSTAVLPAYTIQVVAEMGVSIVALPFIEITHIKNDTLHQTIGHLLNQHINTVFTSAQAVISVVSYITGQQPAWHIFCIGNETLKKVNELMPDATVIGAANSAIDIANVIIDNRINDIYFFCGDIRLDNLPKALQEAKIKLNEIVVYNTAEVHHKVDGYYDGILFYSPSGVKSFFSNNTVHCDTVLFAIGSTTAATIKTFSNNTIVAGDKPSKERMAIDAAAYFTKQETNKI